MSTLPKFCQINNLVNLRATRKRPSAEPTGIPFSKYAEPKFFNHNLLDSNDYILSSCAYFQCLNIN